MKQLNSRRMLYHEWKLGMQLANTLGPDAPNGVKRKRCCLQLGACGMSTQISMSVSVRQIVVCTEDEAEYTEGCKGGRWP